MATTRKQLRDAVLQVYKRTDKNTEINDAINETLREMAAILEPRKLQDRRFMPMAIGQYEYALPDDVLAIQHPIRLVDPTEENTSGSHYPMRHLTKTEYDRYEPFPEASSVNTAKPWAYTIWKNCILVTALPDKAYRMYLNMGAETVELAADSDTMFLQDTFKETVKAGTLARMFALIKRYERDAAFWAGIYNKGYADDGGLLVGGLQALKKSERSVKRAPLIVRNNPL